jgi:hypothetical protein
VATSSTKAEFIAAVSAVKIIKYLCYVLQELELMEPELMLYIGSQAAIHMINDNKPTPCLHNFDIQYLLFKSGMMKALHQWRDSLEIVCWTSRGGWLTVQPRLERFSQPIHFLYADFSRAHQQGAKRDLENCTMKKDDNPKALFEQLIAVQYKYAGNAQARISEDELVTQAVQALPTIYNLTAVGVWVRTSWR